MVSEYRPVKFHARRQAADAARHVQFRVGEVLDAYHKNGGSARLDRGLVEAEVWGQVFLALRGPLTNYPAVHDIILRSSPEVERPHRVWINAHPYQYDALSRCFTVVPRREAGRHPERLALEQFLSEISFAALEALIRTGLEEIPELAQVIARTPNTSSSAPSS